MAFGAGWRRFTTGPLCFRNDIVINSRIGEMRIIINEYLSFGVDVLSVNLVLSTQYF